MTAVVKSAVGKKEGRDCGWERWGEEERGRRHPRRGYKGGCSHPDDDNSFLFPSQPRLARSGFRLLFLPASLPFLQSTEFTPSHLAPSEAVTTKHRSPPYGGILKCIPRSGDPSLLFRVLYQVSVLRGLARAPSLFIHGDGRVCLPPPPLPVASTRLVKVGRAARKGFNAFFSLIKICHGSAGLFRLNKI